MKRGKLTLAVMVLLSACASTPTPSLNPSVPIPSLATLSLPTLEFDSQGCADVGLDASLMGSPTDPRVAWLVDPTGGRIDILWPRGFTARFDPDLEVLDASGMVVYRARDRIRGGCVVDSQGGPLLITPGM
jgi:hypothetical protein